MNNKKINRKQNTFDELVSAYETAANINPGSRESGDALQQLSRAVAYSVLRKIYNASGDQYARRLAIDLAMACRDIDFLDMENSMNNIKCNRNGNIKKIKNSAEYNAVVRRDIGSGIDIAQQAAMLIHRHAVAMLEAGGDVDLQRTYTVLRLDRRVLIRDTDSAAVQEVQTCAMREVYRGVRAYITSNQSPRDTGAAGYSYVRVTHPLDGGDGVYLRLPKHMDAGSVDAMGVYTVGDVDNNAYTALLQLAGKVGLTDRQVQVLTLRMRGDMPGMRAIGTYLGVSAATVADMLRRIRQRLEEFGITPENGFPDGFFD